MQRTIVALTVGLVSALAGVSALAKLPAPVLTDAAKAKAAEVAAKTAWSGKLDAYQLCRSQERVAAHFFATAKAQGQDVRPAVTTPPCTDPGPFAYTPPEPKPAEAAGAHSPAATTAAPPSGTQPAAQVTPTPEKK
jgi:hypothetical protein